MRFCLFLIMLLSYNEAFASDPDTFEYYIDSKSKECKKEKACLVRRRVKDGMLYFVKDYFIPEGTLQVEGAYSDKALEVQEGFFYWYYPNRHLQAKGRYIHGKKMGVWKSYTENDILIDSSYYLNGFPYISSCKWDRNGKLIFKGEYDKDGSGRGYETEFYPDGSLASFGKFSEGYKRDSVWQFYHPNGKIACNVIFDKGHTLQKECLDETGKITLDCDSTNLKKINDGIMKHVMSTLRYPEDARDHGNQGQVLVHFIINMDGTISNVVPYAWSIGTTQSCVNEAVRVIKTIPNVGPVRIYNKAVEYGTFQSVFYRLD